jgi:hypothetical protein
MKGRLMLRRPVGRQNPVVAAHVIRVSRTPPYTVIFEGDDREIYHWRFAKHDPQSKSFAKAWIFGIAALAVGLPMNPYREISFPKQCLRDLPHIVYPSQQEEPLGEPAVVLADLVGGRPVRPFLFLPQSDARYVTNKADFLGMYLFDIWAERNVPRRALFRRTGRSRDIRATFFNDGNFIAEQDWSPQASANCLCRQTHSLYQGLCGEKATQSWLDVFRRAIPAALDEAVASLPAIWRSRDDDMLRQRLVQRLHVLPTLAVAYPVSDAIFQSNTLNATRGIGEGLKAFA